MRQVNRTSLIFIGDTHAKFKHLKIICDQFFPLPCIQLGDMGMGFNFDHEFPKCPNLFWTRGNHDKATTCRKTKGYLGDFGYLEFDDLFYVGGAYSIDQARRIEGKSWWRDEELTEQQADECIELYQKTKPQVVCSHDAPLLLYGQLGVMFPDGDRKSVV